MTSLTGLPTRLSISTSVSMVNLAVFLFTTSDTRGRETIRISAASACFKNARWTEFEDAAVNHILTSLLPWHGSPIKTF